MRLSVVCLLLGHAAAIPGKTIDRGWLYRLPNLPLTMVLRHMGQTTRDIMLAAFADDDWSQAMEMAASFAVGRSFTDRLFDKDLEDFRSIINSEQIDMREYYTIWATVAQRPEYARVACHAQSLITQISTGQLISPTFDNLIVYMLECDSLHHLCSSLSKNLSYCLQDGDKKRLLKKAIECNSFASAKATGLIRELAPEACDIILDASNRRLNAALVRIANMVYMSISIKHILEAAKRRGRYDIAAIVCNTALVYRTHMTDAKEFISNNTREVFSAFCQLKEPLHGARSVSGLGIAAILMGLHEIAQEILVKGAELIVGSISDFPLLRILQSYGWQALTDGRFVTAFGKNRLLAAVLRAEIQCDASGIMALNLNLVKRHLLVFGATYALACAAASHDYEYMVAAIIYVMYEDVPIEAIGRCALINGSQVLEYLRQYTLWREKPLDGLIRANPLVVMISCVNNMTCDAYETFLYGHYRTPTHDAPRLARQWLARRTVATGTLANEQGRHGEPIFLPAQPRHRVRTRRNAFFSAI